MGTITLKDHGPHVDARSSGVAGRVILAACLTGSGTQFTVTRSTADPAHYVIDPSTQETQAAAETLAAHPEFALSRREILKYVIAEPAERAKSVGSYINVRFFGAYGPYGN